MSTHLCFIFKSLYEGLCNAVKETINCMLHGMVDQGVSVLNKEPRETGNGGEREGGERSPGAKPSARDWAGSSL